MTRLLKGQSVGGLPNPETGGGIGPQGSALVIKMAQYQTRSRAPLEDTQAEDEADPTYEHHQPYHAISLNGWVVDGQKIGLESMEGKKAAVTLLLGAKHKLVGTLAISQVEVGAWHRNRTNVPIALSGKVAGGLVEQVS